MVRSLFLMSLTVRVLIGLVAGFLVGLVAPAPVVSVLAPVGTLFINLIRVTVFPLVVSMLIASIGAIASSRALGRAGGRAMALALVLLTVAAAGSALVAVPVLERVQIDRAAVQALQPAVPATPPASVTTVADSRVAQRFVAAVLELAPFGVFALAAPLAARLGLAAAGAVGVYIVLVVSLTVVASLILLYPLGIVGGRMRPAAFASFCAPAQAVAFSSRSSLAALPAMLETAEQSAAPPMVAGFILPLAASVFRFGAAIA